MSACERLKIALKDESSDTVVLTRADALSLLTQCEQVNTEPCFARHYKGGLYQILFEVTFEADKSPMMVYRAANGTLWSRFKDNFFETVQIDGKSVARFSVIKDV